MASTVTLAENGVIGNEGIGICGGGTTALGVVTILNPDADLFEFPTAVEDAPKVAVNGTPDVTPVSTCVDWLSRREFLPSWIALGTLTCMWGGDDITGADAGPSSLGEARSAL